MKKGIIMCATIGVFAIESGFSMSSAVVSVGNRQIASISGNVGAMTARAGIQNIEVHQQPEIRYDSFVFSGNNVLVSFSKGVRRGEAFISNECLEKSYPYEKEFVGLDYADDNHSYAIYKVFANTEEAGRLELTSQFVDENIPLEHKKRITGTPVYDDEALMTKGTVETYVMLDGIERTVSTETNKSLPYSFIRTEKDSKYVDAPDGGDNVRIYARWNGEEVRKNWEGLELIEKKVQQPPVQPPAPQSGSTSSGGHKYSSNDVEAIVQRVEDCNVM